MTISWSSFVGDGGGPDSFVRKQVEALEANRSAYMMYNFLRANGFSVDDIVAVSRIAFSWNGFATLPYAYAVHDPSQLLSLLAGAEGAGAGSLFWPKENRLKTAY